MAPKSQLVRKNTAATKQNGKPAKVPPTPQSPDRELGVSPLEDPLHSYAERQDEEIISLQSILGDENVELIDMKGAWNRTPDKAFNIRIKPLAYPDTFVVLSVRFTATYPKTVPILSIKECSTDIQAKTTQIIEAFLKAKPKELLGEEMIYTITSEIEEILENAVLAKQKNDALPSLETERAVQEAAETERQAQALRDQEQQRVEAEAEAQDRLNQMVEIQMKKKEEERKRKNRHLEKLDLAIDVPPERVVFDSVISVEDSDIQFRAVYLMSMISKGPVTTVSRAMPVGGTTPLIVKRLRIKSSTKSSKAGIVSLERELQSLKNLRHPNIAAVLSFKIDTELHDDGWEVFVLTTFGNKGSLTELLDMVDTAPLPHVRSWTIELLEALHFYHSHGIIHKDIHPGNVLICKTTGKPFVRLADAGFQKTLHQLAGICDRPFPLYSENTTEWVAPELGDPKAPYTNKADVWALGVLFVQMLFGLGVVQKYSSPRSLIDELELSDPLEDLMYKFFKLEPKSRPTAFDIVPSEFLRSDIPVLDPSSTLALTRRSSAMSPLPSSRSRRGSFAIGGPTSRYASDWVEAARLGKGGFGEVVKARNKFDGRFYAIKKITLKSAPALDKVLSEVMLLSQLNHPCVVRYFTAWREVEFSYLGSADADDYAISDSEEDLTSSMIEDRSDNIEFTHSTGDLDFISSSGYPKIEFGEDSDDNESSGTAEELDLVAIGRIPTGSDQSTIPDRRHQRLSKKNSQPTPVRTMLYIQMEFCERRTLRDLIIKGIYNDVEESWRLFREILEGLDHIHRAGIIHRDLKPDNVFIDVANNPRIGDFGLATIGEYQLDGRGGSTGQPGGDMTRSVGTALYVAPELKSTVRGHYDNKVDMYSLGIIFFEMCHPFRTAMERDQVIRRLREKEHTLPPDFDQKNKVVQGEIIMSLLNHRPSERPSTVELLKGGKIPVKLEPEIVKWGVRAILDDKSPYHQQMVSALFSDTPEKQANSLIWPIITKNTARKYTMSERLMQGIVKTRLAEIFERHGAVGTDRDILFPDSSIYTDSNPVQLISRLGQPLQLPYDLTLPHAYEVARNPQGLEKTYTIGRVFRDLNNGGAPKTDGEADFDIISHDRSDMALKEAEVIKVMDEIVHEFPPLAVSQMSIHLNHSGLLELIMDFSRISVPKRIAVKEVLSRLNVHDWTWQKIRDELRSARFDISATSLNDLARFDFRDTPDKAFSTIREILEDTEYLGQANRIFSHMQSVLGYLKLFGVRCPVFISPLSCINRVYTSGILFQCLRDKKRRDILAAGGRYDKLIESEKSVQGHSVTCGAVGMKLPWERIVGAMIRHQENVSKRSFLKKASAEDVKASGNLALRQYDVLVASFDPLVLRTSGIKILGELWENNISAGLAVDAHSQDELLSHYRENAPSWIIIIKHDASVGGKLEIRVKSLVRKEDADVRSSELISYLRTEMRDRQQREGITRLATRGPAKSNHSEGTSNTAKIHNVQVLFAQHRSKKSNKWLVIEAAQEQAQKLLHSYRNAPIAAIETRDEILDQIGKTRLSDADSWRQAVQSAPLGDRNYLMQVQNMLERFRQSWRDGEHEQDEVASRVAFVYNFRTSACVLYDLAL